MKDLFSDIEENEEIDETVKEICENEDRFNNNYCKDSILAKPEKLKNDKR
jgi:hypothetical protein